MSPAPPAEVVCAGLATRDTIVAMPGWPDPDGRLVVERIERSGGGPAATAAVTLARLGIHVAFLGVVGADEAGREVRGGLEREGVDVSGLAHGAGGTPESVVLLDTASATRTILHAPGTPLPPVGAVPDGAWVHVDHAGYPAVAGRVPPELISVDAGNPIPALDVAGLGLYAPTSRALAARYPGSTPAEGMGRALADGARRVVVTLGADGAMAADATGAWRAGSAQSDVVSTLGAGDVFHGALLASLVRGQALPDALRRANLAAALSCRALDGRAAIPSADELDAHLTAAPAPERIVPEATR